MKKENDAIPAGYVRVTEVLTPFSGFSGVNPESSFGINIANAADRGERTHGYCEAHALGLFIEDCDEDCKNYVDAFKKWFDTMVEKVIHAEIRLNSATYRISGKFDMLCILKGDVGLTLVDYKTPQAESSTWQLQTAAYQILVEECLGLKVDRRICLMLPKTPSSVKVVEYAGHERDKELYLKALELHRFFKG